MAFPADSGVPRPFASPPAALLRLEWLVCVAYAALLAAVLAMNGTVAHRSTSVPSDVGVCAQRLSMIAPGLFLVPLH